jgi:hypothetical protein
MTVVHIEQASRPTTIARSADQFTRSLPANRVRPIEKSAKWRELFREGTFDRPGSMKVEITGSPLLGERTDEVLAELGYTADWAASRRKAV